MSYSAKILADSISPDGVRLITVQTTYPRFIHAEVLRHRTLSHNVASSRAIPTEKLIEMVRTNPFVPETFNLRVKGMGIGDEMDPMKRQQAEAEWRNAARYAAMCAERLNEIGLDKSRANRILEPFVWVTDIMTGTEWANFFALRCHPDAQIEFQKLAFLMRDTFEASTPQPLDYDQWHLPMVTKEELAVLCEAPEQIDVWKLVSAGRCARVSFDTHERFEDPMDSVARAERLVSVGHLSPFEHVARPMQIGTTDNRFEPLYEEGPTVAFAGNLRGWVQARKEIPNEDNFGKLIEVSA